MLLTEIWILVRKSFYYKSESFNKKIESLKIRLTLKIKVKVLKYG